MNDGSYLGRLRLNVRADLPFHLLVALYAGAALLLALYLGRPEKMLALMYAGRFMPWAIGMLSAFVAWQALASIKAPSPLQELKGRLGKALTPAVVTRGLLFTNIAIFYGVFTSFKRMLSDIRPFSYDHQLAEMDRVVHGADPWLLFPYSEALTRFIQFFYLQGWLACLVIFSCYVIVFQERALVSRFITAFYLTWIFLGNLVASIFMSAGPVYYEKITGSRRFEPLLDQFEFSFGMANSSVAVQDRLWLDYMLDLGLLGSGISAFPSLHVAMATLWALTAWSINKALSGFFVAVLILVQLSSVYLGWHYAVDGYFSFIAVILIWVGVGRLFNPTTDTVRTRAMAP